MPRTPSAKRRKSSPLPIKRLKKEAAGAAGESPAADALSPILTPYTMKNAAVEQALLTGDNLELLEDYFGSEQLNGLRRLAREAGPRSVIGGDRVLILPGIMGSTLGYPSQWGWDDVIWIDPVDIALGNLKSLKLDNGQPGGIEPLGVVLFAYLSLKLRLRASGFDADFHAFDWRLGIRALGRTLAERLSNEKGRVHLVAHSMGGLVARAVLEQKPANLGRIVTLGTPNFGSYAPIQAFRGVHPIIQRLARLDITATHEDLGRIFGTFPGLCEMFPAVSHGGGDFFSLRSWPRSGVLPDNKMLDDCRETLGKLPLADPRLTQIIGYGQETVVAAEIHEDEFVYTTSLDGDGTVPLALARVPETPGYYIAEDHGALVNNLIVARAVEDILTTGRTARLPDRLPERRGERRRTIAERQLTADRAGEREGMRRAPGTREARHLLNEFVSPMPPSRAAFAQTEQPAGSDAAAPVLIDRVVIGRRRQLRLDLTLAFGDITEVDASAYVLGLFSQVSPGGAAKSIDASMDGAIMQMNERRLLSANVGAVSFFPKGRHPVRADLIAFVGLGPFDSFKEETLEAATESLIRTLLLTRVDDFAVVPFGGGSGIDAGKALRHMMSGFIRGLVDADGDQRFRGITICEIDSDRYRHMLGCLYQLCGTPLFDDVEVTLREKRLPALRQPSPRDVAGAQPVYLIVRENNDNNGNSYITSSLLTAGEKATTFSSAQPFSIPELEAHLKQIAPGVSVETGALPAFGRRLAELLLREDMREVLSRYAAQHLVVVHDADASKIPWETLHIGDHAPALSAGLSHRYEAKDLSTTKWLHKRQLSRMLNILLIVNPTADLKYADAEGERIKGLFSAPGVAITIDPYEREAARRAPLLEALSSGKYDVVHYAGHAFFDADSPERSGILCAGGDVLSGNDLAPLANLPSLMFFNACEAARIRRGIPPMSRSREPEVGMTTRLRQGVGFAEALLRGGVANYVGTYWPVADKAAASFANSFYRALLEGRSLGEVVLKARRSLAEAGYADWANYILFGDPNFVLKPGREGENDSAYSPTAAR